MIELRCTVRNCGKMLRSEGKSLRCDSGHCFDRAREGYWNLTQPQDKKSANPGDSDQAVLARQRWLQRGHARGLIETLKNWTSFKVGGGQPGNVIDIGCGEGSFGPALFSNNAMGYCGIDLSRKAIRLAARHWPEGTWVLANADRGLPFADGSIDLIVSLFGRRPVDEMNRVLTEDGCCLVAIPGEEDLIELRERVQQSGQRRSRRESVANEMQSAGFEPSEQKTWTQQVDLESDEIMDALSMTYRAFRKSEQERLRGVERMKVTLAADLLLFRKERSGPGSPEHQSP